MALDPVVNFFRSTIATLPVASGGTSIVITTGDGAKLPDPAVDGAFNLTIYNEDDPFDAPEIVRVTAIVGDTLTVTRAQEGTSATNKTSGNTWYLELTPTAKTIQDIDTAKLDVADVVNNLTSTDTNKALSANQGKVLQDGKLNLSGGTMTGDLTIPDKIIHSGDTDTAIRFPANDTFAVETNGSERMRVTSDGRVGFGVTDFTTDSGVVIQKDVLRDGAWNSKLALKSTGAGNFPALYFTGVANSRWGGIVQTTSTSGSDGNTTAQISFPYAGDEGRILFRTAENTTVANASDKMTIRGNGNVGIGTTNPATKLDVNGTANATNLTRGGSQVYSRNNIVGSVSQSGGVPTGAIVERGSNANGEYIRYADGTQICWKSVSSARANVNIAFGANFFRSTADASTLPANFVDTNYWIASNLDPIDGGVPATFMRVSRNATSSVAVGKIWTASIAGTDTFNVPAVVFGRWF